jgi:hypothetical protein
MSTIVIKPKTKEEESFLAALLDRMNVEAHFIIEEPQPNYSTLEAIHELESGKGRKVKDSDELFSQLGIWRNLSKSIAMYFLIYSGKFKKDVKLLQKRGYDMTDYFKKCYSYSGKERWTGKAFFAT